jgi:hypothetical protein
MDYPVNVYITLKRFWNFIHIVFHVMQKLKVLWWSHNFSKILAPSILSSTTTRLLSLAFLNFLFSDVCNLFFDKQNMSEMDCMTFWSPYTSVNYHGKNCFAICHFAIFSTFMECTLDVNWGIAVSSGKRTEYSIQCGLLNAAIPSGPIFYTRDRASFQKNIYFLYR